MTKNFIIGALKVLYQEMYELTEPECANNCRVPRYCCTGNGHVCEQTIKRAREVFGVTLQRTDHPTIPLMGAAGCTAAPHFRSDCTMHTCSVNSLGFKVGDAAWNETYFDLRGRIYDLEGELYDIRKGGQTNDGQATA